MIMEGMGKTDKWHLRRGIGEKCVMGKQGHHMKGCDAVSGKETGESGQAGNGTNAY